MVKLAGTETIAGYVLDQLSETLDLTWAVTALGDDTSATSPNPLVYPHGDLHSVPTTAVLLAPGPLQWTGSASRSVRLVANAEAIGVLAVGPERRDVGSTSEDETLITALAPLVATALQSALRERRLEAQLDRLTASEKRYRRLVEFSPEPIAVDCDGLLEYIDPAGIRTLGAVRLESWLDGPRLTSSNPPIERRPRTDGPCPRQWPAIEAAPGEVRTVGRRGHRCRSRQHFDNVRGPAGRADPVSRRHRTDPV